MKSLIYIFLFFVFVNIAFSQEEDQGDPQIEKIAQDYKAKNKATDNKTIAYIDYKVTKDQTFDLLLSGNKVKKIYVKTSKDVDGYTFAALFTGWSEDAKTKEKVNLIGALYYSKLYLYNIGNRNKKEFEDFLKEVLFSGYDSDEVESKLSSNKGYDERYVINFSKNKNKERCSYTDKKQKINYIMKSDLKIFDEFYTLKIKYNDKSKFQFDLNKLYKYHKNFQIVTAKSSDGKMRVLLYYIYESSSNPFGECGVGYETGFILLEFDSKGKIISNKEEMINSCFKMIFFEKEESSEQIHKYSITEQDFNEGDKHSLVTVDLNVPSIKVTKIK